MSACFRASSFTLRALKLSERSIKHFGTLRRRDMAFTNPLTASRKPERTELKPRRNIKSASGLAPQSCP